MGELYINSLEDEDAETRVEGGVVYSKREMLLDGYHGYKTRYPCDKQGNRIDSRSERGTEIGCRAAGRILDVKGKSRSGRHEHGK